MLALESYFLGSFQLFSSDRFDLYSQYQKLGLM